MIITIEKIVIPGKRLAVAKTALPRSLKALCREIVDIIVTKSKKSLRSKLGRFCKNPRLEFNLNALRSQSAGAARSSISLMKPSWHLKNNMFQSC